MIGQQLLSERKLQLLNALKAGLKSSRTHTTAFAFRVLPQIYQEELFDSGAIELSPPLNPTYGGYANVAFLGFRFAANPTDEDLAKNFLEGYERLKKRDNAANRPFFLDDVALLGVADGLAALPHVNHERSWLLTGIEQHSGQQQWSSRMRDLACDLLDRRGRLRVAINFNDINTLTLTLILRSIWANPVRQ